MHNYALNVHDVYIGRYVRDVLCMNSKLGGRWFVVLLIVFSFVLETNSEVKEQQLLD